MNKLICITALAWDSPYFPRMIREWMSAWPEVRGTADTDGGAYSPFRSILLVLTHDSIIIQLYGQACGDG